jgi:hypothetical protein
MVSVECSSGRQGGRGDMHASLVVGHVLGPRSADVSCAQLLTHATLQLLDVVPVVLVELGRVPRPCRAHAGVPLDGRLA